jgi:Phosphodiester glycosidase
MLTQALSWRIIEDRMVLDFHFLKKVIRGSRLASAMLLMLATLGVLVAGGTPEWQALAPGMDVKYLIPHGASDSDSAITVLRMDPKQWELALVGISQTGESAGHTAREWCGKEKFAAAINAGMFSTDGKTHIGYMRSGENVNNSKRDSYQSVAAFNPREARLPAFHIFDLDAPGVTLEGILKDYGSVVQNLRLIKRVGVDVWQPQEKKWSVAALGEDDAGRILFIFSRTPFSMHDLNQQLLGAGIGIVASQHLEGGPEAQLYFHAGNIQKEMVGTGGALLQETGVNAIAWPIPNVLAVRPRQPIH